MFHDETDRVLDLQVLRSAAPLLLRCRRVFLVLDVFQCVLDQVAHSPMLGRVQCLNVLQDVQNLRPTTNNDTSKGFWSQFAGKKVCSRPDLLRPDAQVEVEASLQEQVLHIVRVDGEVEVQRVSQQLVGLLIAVPDRKHTINENIKSGRCD